MVTAVKSIAGQTAIQWVQQTAAPDAADINHHCKEAVMNKRNLLFITVSSLFLVTGFTACRHGHHRGFDEFET